jgi:hypothetical protein
MLICYLLVESILLLSICGLVIELVVKDSEWKLTDFSTCHCAGWRRSKIHGAAFIRVLVGASVGHHYPDYWCYVFSVFLGRYRSSM